MGIIRSGVVLMLGAVLFLTLFTGNTFLTLTWALEHDNIQTNMKNISVKAFDSFGFRDVIEDNYDAMILYCNSNPSFTYSAEGISIDVPCNTINMGIDNVIEYGASQIIEDLYYREYNCSFFKCLKEENGFYVLVSEKAYDYWHSKFYLVSLLSIILFVLMLVVSTKRNSAFITAGVLTIISAIPFRRLDWILKLVPSGDIGSIFIGFFSKSYNVFFTMTVIGVVLIIIGVAFTFLNVGSIITGFIEKITPERKKKKGEMPVAQTNEELNNNKESQKETFTREEVKKIVKEEIAKSKNKSDSPTLNKVEKL